MSSDRVRRYATLTGRSLGPAAAVVVAAAILMPILIIVWSSVWSGPVGYGGHATLGNVHGVLGQANGLRMILTTIGFALGSAAVGVVIGAALAWGIASVDFPGKRWLRPLPLGVLLLPPLLKDPAWIELYSPKIGLVNRFFDGISGSAHGVFNIYSLEGMIAVMGCNIVPIAYAILVPPFSSLDPSLLEASRISGAREWRTTIRIALPILRPALYSAAALAVILAASSFETPVLIGLPGGVVTLMSAIYNTVNNSENMNLASAQSLLYLIMTCIVLVWYIHSTRMEKKFVTVGGQGKGVVNVRSRAARALVPTGFIVYFVIAFVLPVLMTALVSFLPYYSSNMPNPFTLLTLSNYSTILSAHGVYQAAETSLLLSAVAAVASTAISLIFGYLALKTRLRGRRFIELLGTLPIAVPALVFGLALLVSVVSIPALRSFYNGYVPLFFAEIVVFLPFALRVLSGALIQIDDSLLEAAVMSGASRIRAIRDVLVPLLRNAIGNAALLIFTLSLRELGAVVLLVGVNTTLLPSLMFEYWQNAQFGPTAALNILGALLPLAVAGAAWLLGKGVVVVVGQARASSAVQMGNASWAEADAS